MHPAASWSICFALAYLCGSIPFGLLIGFARGIDIRQHGSKNIGATNTGRVLGKPFGYAAFALDLLKGLVPVLGAGWWMGVLDAGALSAGDAAVWMLAAACAVAGHVFPVWLGFKGGKGVATSFGALLGVWPHLTIPAAAAFLVWIIVVKATRYVSVASCAAAVSIPITLVILFVVRGGTVRESSSLWPFLGMTVALGALVIWKHRANFARLRLGTEPKINSTTKSH